MEPVKNGYGDNYYMQTIQNVRKWKYSEAKHYEYAEKSVDITSFEESAWESAAVYLDFTGQSAQSRNHPAFDGSFSYTDTSDRNDIASVRVLHDSKYVYFRVQTDENVTALQSGDTGWMNILYTVWRNRRIVHGLPIRDQPHGRRRSDERVPL